MRIERDGQRILNADGPRKPDTSGELRATAHPTVELQESAATAGTAAPFRGRPDQHLETGGPGVDARGHSLLRLLL